MTTATVDMAGGSIGGAARLQAEVRRYLERSARDDIKVIGARRRLSPAWLAAREAAAVRRSRRVALNNVGFLTPGGERWTLISNALHFLTGPEAAALDPGLRAAVSRQARVVHGAARRSDVLVAPCTAMAGRISGRATRCRGSGGRAHAPVSAGSGHRARRRCLPRCPDESLILCPVLFAPYKHMADRLAEWLAAADGALDDSVRMIVTADTAEVPAWLAASPRLHFVGTARVQPAERAVGPQPRDLLPDRPGIVRLAAGRGPGLRAAGHRAGHGAEPGDRGVRAVRLHPRRPGLAAARRPNRRWPRGYPPTRRPSIRTRTSTGCWELAGDQARPAAIPRRR